MPRMEEPENHLHEKRAQVSADALPAMLTKLATAGIGAAYAVGIAARSESIAIHLNDLWRSATACFVVSLLCVVRSWFLVKRRALLRHNAILSKTELPSFAKWSRHSSWAWDTASAWLLMVGAIALAFAIHR